MNRINNILSDVNSALTQQSKSCEDMVDSPRLTLEDMKELLEIQVIQQKLNQFKNIKAEDGDFLEIEDTEIESIEQEMMEYMIDFYDMSVGSLMAIMSHAQKIIENLSNPQIAENLTESWLQGKIAITEDYMRTIHDFVMYVNQSDDNTEAANRPGLWENIRKKKEKMGKNYRPAKTGDKDRPDSKTWKKLTDKNKKV
jgi:hypothetical protein